jgi:hypothetical protein
MSDISYWPVGSVNLGTIQQQAAATPAPAHTHYAVITDESGSMGWAEDKMKRDLVTHLEEIPDGSYLSLGWFSSQSQYRWYMVGFKIDPDSRADAAKIIERHSGSWNMTCYTDILTDLPNILESASLADAHSLVFMSDGHPNQGGGQDEILRLIRAAADKLSSVTIVGYGDYYNRQLLAEMAKAAGGSLVHASNVQDFGRAVTGVIKMRQTSKRIMISVPKNTKVLFSIENGVVTVHDANEDQISVSPTATVYFPVKDIQARIKAEMTDPYGPAYGLALAQLRSNDIDAAIDTLSNIGDVKMVQLVSTAITNDEFGAAETALSECVVDLTKRFGLGQKVGCAPDPFAPDVLDVLNLLVQDKDAKFLPYHPAFNYKRIGRGTVVNGDFPKFQASPNSGTPVTEIVWHKERLNANVRAFIKGHVDLRDVNGQTPEELGFSRNRPVGKYREYSIVNNGNLNVRTLPVVDLSRDTFEQLVAWGVLDEGSVYYTGTVDLLHLDRLPVLSRGKRQPVDAEAYAINITDSLKLGAGLKLFKALLDEVSPKEERIVTSYSPEQVAFLAANGMDEKGNYDPPTKRSEATDVIPAREFYVSVKGLSSLPNLKAVREKTEKIRAWTGKGKEPKYTAGEALLVPWLEEYEAHCAGWSKALKVTWLEEQIETLKEAKQVLDKYINQVKFVMLMTGSWFEGWPRGETKVTDGAFEVTFNTGEVELEI